MTEQNKKKLEIGEIPLKRAIRLNLEEKENFPELILEDRPGFELSDFRGGYKITTKRYNPKIYLTLIKDLQMEISIIPYSNDNYGILKVINNKNFETAMDEHQRLLEDLIKTNDNPTL